MTKKHRDYSLRGHLENGLNIRTTGAGVFGGSARPLDVIEDFYLDVKFKGLTFSKLKEILLDYYSNRWMDGMEENRGFIDFFTKDGFKPHKKVRVFVEPPREKHYYYRIRVEDLLLHTNT